MKTILIIGGLFMCGLLSWGLIAGAHEDEDDEKEFSGLLEDDDE